MKEIEKYVDEYELYLKSIDSSQNTISAYRQDLKLFFDWYKNNFNTVTLSDIGPLDISEYKEHLKSKKRRPATINRAITSLNQFFEWAKENGYISFLPTENIKLLPHEKQVPRQLDRREQQAFMRAVYRGGKARDIAIMTTFLHTGIRVQELVGLNLEDVAIKPRSGYINVRYSKGQKSRTIGANRDVRNTIRDYLMVRGEEPGPLFLSQKGGRMTQRNVEYLVKKYAYNARLDNVTPHVLRHTLLKRLADRGYGLEKIRRIAGHDNINTTTIYTEPTEQELFDALENIAWD